MDISQVWEEVLFVGVLIVGFILAILISNMAVSYIIIFLCGAIFGKALYHKKDDFFLPYVLLTIGFVVGYLLGHRTGSIWIIIMIFALGNLLSFFAHEKKLF